MNTIRLSGPVLSNPMDIMFYDLSGQDYISSSKVNKMLQDFDGEDIIINLNSVGGSVYDGTEIYTLLKMYKGKVTVNVTGLAASIATVIMLGADEVNIAKPAQIMIHRPSLGLNDYVDAQDLTKILNGLNSTEKSIVTLYNEKTGLSENELLKLMFEETWMTSQEAVDRGFVDNIIDYDEQQESIELVASYDNQIEQLAEFRKLMYQLKSDTRGEEMDKTFIDKVRNLLNQSDDTEVEVESPIEEEKENKESEVIEDSDEPIQETEASEEAEAEVDNELVTALETATNKLEELIEENKTLKDKLAVAESEMAVKTETANKATNIINKLNELVESEKKEVIMVNQTTENKEVQRGRFNFGGNVDA